MYMSVTVFSTPLCGRSEYVCVCVCVCAQHTCTGVQYIYVFACFSDPGTLGGSMSLRSKAATRKVACGGALTGMA